jgi:lipopolysaccharide heptosyltransferase I
MSRMFGSSRPPLQELTPRRIALLKPSALGDIVHSLPVLTALRRRFPHSHLTWIVNRAYAPLLAGHPHLDSVLPFERGAHRRGWLHALSAHASFIRELRGGRFDLVIDLQGLFRSGLMSVASGAARRVGLSTAREGAPWFYTDVIPTPALSDIHAVDRYWLVAQALGAGSEVLTFHVHLDPAACRWAEEQLRPLARPWIMLGPGSRWLTKRWLPQHFAELAQRIHRHFGGSICLVGGADEMDLAQAVRAHGARPALDVTGSTTLPQLAALLARSDLMLANDTGPLHLAAALGRPVVAPYTCTSVRRTGPYRFGHALGGAVETRVWCQASYLKRCDRMECMAELTPDRLWPLVQEVLLTWQRQTRSA